MNSSNNNWNKQRNLLSNIEKYPSDKNSYKELYTFYKDLDLYDLCNSLVPLCDNESTIIDIKDRMYLETVIDEKHINKDKQFDYRVLYIPFLNYPNYGLDCIYDGLCKVLGWDKVIEYPEKDTLHGGTSSQCNNYPCFFKYPKKVFSEIDIIECIKKSEIDFIIYCYTENNTNIRLLEKISKMSSIPIYILDQEDTYEINYSKLSSIKNIRKIFKREMLLNNTYDNRVLPLNFSYPSEYINSKFEFDNKSNDLFWAGKRYYLRGRYLDILNKYTTDENVCLGIYSKEEYLKKISNTKIGINLFGWGFDTVRYYEYPANCCMLLSERPQIHILNPLKNNQHCIYFSDILDFEDKLKYYLKNIKEVKDIALNGYNHIKKYHTTEYRAKQLLSFIEEDL